MPKSDITAFTLVAALIGALVAQSAPASFGLTPFAVGLMLIIVLLVFDGEQHRTMWQSVAYAAVTGYCALVSTLGGLGLLNRLSAQTVPSSVEFHWQPLLWIGATAAFCVIDRVRSNSGAPRSLLMPYAEPTTVVSPPSVAQAPPAASSRVAVQPEPIAIAAGAGKPATIYLNLVGEGLNCLRSVGAEHMGKDYYRIVEPVPPGETWEFSTGQIVRCQKRTLSNGKALVAVEEAPRAS